MEQRTLELQLVSAKDLKKLHLLFKRNVLAFVSIVANTHNGMQVTEVFQNCGTNLLFNLSPLLFTLDDSLLSQPNRLFLQIELLCKGTLCKRIGAVRVPLKELFDLVDPKNMKLISVQLFRPSGRPQGELSFSYKFGDKFTGPVKRPVKAHLVGAPKRNPPPLCKVAREGCIHIAWGMIMLRLLGIYH